MPTQDEVRLVLPAMPEYLRLARVTAAGLASRLDFTVDQVEDLRLAIDELCFTLTGDQGRPGGTVELRYTLGEDFLAVEGTGRFDPGTRTAPAERSELSELILAALVDEHEISGDGDGPRFSLVKRRATPGEHDRTE
ncbi:MAG: ATP-binding protein [Acidimicrobiales bacterium]